MQKQDRILFTICVIGLFFSGFLTGALAIYFHLPPYAVIDRAIEAAQAWDEQKTLDDHEELLIPIIKLPSTGLRAKTNRTFGGYTLYTYEGLPKAILLDMDGHEIHQWQMPSAVQPHAMIKWQDVELLPGGELLAVHESRESYPYDEALVKLDKDSHLLWRYDAHIHHTIHIGPDGTICALVNDVTPPPHYDGIAFDNSFVLNEQVVLLTQDGKEKARYSLLDSLANSQYKPILQKIARTHAEKGDVLHSNSAMVLTNEMARAFPMFKAGQILVSMRNPGMIAVLDPQTKNFIWAAKGPWFMQHYAEFAPDGTIVLFDNLGLRNTSRILRYHPANDTTDVIFTGSMRSPFFSKTRGMQQQLPNGDLLITESNMGRIFEVNSKKEVVWDFITPYQRNRPLTIDAAKRYAPQQVTFLK